MGIPEHIARFLELLFIVLAIIFLGLFGYGVYLILSLGSDAINYIFFDPVLALVLGIFFGLLSQLVGRVKTSSGPCKTVRAEIEYTKKVIEAFEDESLLKGCNTREDYEKKIFNKLKGHKSASGTDKIPHSPMGTHPMNCEISPGGTGSEYDADWKEFEKYKSPEKPLGRFEDWIKDKYYKDLPDIIWEADRAHEQVHIDKCREVGGGRYYKDMHLGDLNNLRKEELEAYKVKLKMLENWLNNNC